MKNNHGWGLGEMLLFIALLLFFLLVATFYVLRLYGGLAHNNQSVEIESAVNEYLYKKYGSQNAPYDLMISLDTLKEETSLEISDDCKGYVMVVYEDGASIIKNKISCD